MKSRTSMLLVFSFLMAAVVWALALPAAEPDGTEHARWEHLALTHNDANVSSTGELPQRIIRLGNDGWELVNVSTVVKEGSTEKTIFYFKRPK